MTLNLDGKIVVITDASSGFGRGAAVALARAGASVGLGARRLEDVLEVEAACASEGGEALSKEVDVGDPIDVAELARDAVARFGRIDVWINNAGASAVGRFDVLPLEDHVRVIDTTLLGTLYGSYVALRQFHKQGSGTLINIASLAGKVRSPFDASYAAAEHGVVALTAALRLELEDGDEGPRDIRVCTILPDAYANPAFHAAERGFGEQGDGDPVVETPVPVGDPEHEDLVEAMLAVARQPRDETTVGSAGAAPLAPGDSPGLAKGMRAEGLPPRRATSPTRDDPERDDHEGGLLDPTPVGAESSGRKADSR